MYAGDKSHNCIGNDCINEEYWNSILIWLIFSEVYNFNSNIDQMLRW